MVVAAKSVYPKEYEVEVLLRDGSRMRIQPIKPDDAPLWLRFVNRLSEHTKYLRFHYVPGPMTLEDAIRNCTVDYDNSFALIAKAFHEGSEEIVGVARYNRLPNRWAAEVAFAIADEYQGKGVGTKLMETLVRAALDHGVRTFEASVLPENREMMDVFKSYGFHIDSELADGLYRVSFHISPTTRISQRAEEREKVSTLASIRYLLYPHSVAVIGASREPHGIGHILFKAILESGFSGVVYPVNPNAEAIMAVKAHRSVLDVPDPIDLATIVVPAPLVTRVADECGRKGVRALIVISDGFRESGEAGAAREEELRQITLGYGMRLLGPNCMGVINTDAEVNLNSTFSPVYPPRGNVAFLSQSGALGLAIIEYATNLNIGISSFVSDGNHADISSDDLLQYWEQDPATDVILLYLESFGRPRRFSRIAKRVSALKPIIAVKSGRTQAGSRAASSHTGMLATSETVSAALFKQAGIIRVNTVEELFDTAALLSNQPLPKGRRVAIVTNGGGPGILAADACENQGLSLPEFSEETKSRLKEAVVRDINVRNPMDMTAGAGGEEYEKVLDILAADQDVDAVLAIFIPPVVAELGATEEAIRRVAPIFQQHRKPLLACFMGQRGVELGADKRAVPSYIFPEDATSALARSVEYSEWRSKPKGVIPKLTGMDRGRARQIVENALRANSERPIWLGIEQMSELLKSYGIRFVETAFAGTPEEAALAASGMGFPVVVKLASATITHKTDVGGVVLDLRSASEVVQAFNEIRARLGQIGRESEMEGVMVQRMIEDGIEVIAGVSHDLALGPLIMFGLGGIYTELLNDVVFRLQPLTDLDAREMVRSLKAAKLFEGVRGAPPADVAAIEDLLLRLSAMIEDIPEVAELDLNPIKVLPQGEGYRVVDARIMVK